MKAEAEEANKQNDTFSLKGLPQMPFTTYLDLALHLTPPKLLQGCLRTAPLPSDLAQSPQLVTPFLLRPSQPSHLYIPRCSIVLTEFGNTSWSWSLSSLWLLDKMSITDNLSCLPPPSSTCPLLKESF